MRKVHGIDIRALNVEHRRLRPDETARRVLTFGRELERIDPSFAGLTLAKNGRVAGHDGWADEDALVDAIPRLGMVFSLDKPYGTLPNRRISYSPRMVLIGATDEFWDDPALVRRVLARTIEFWEADEAGVNLMIFDEGYPFWLRWRRSPEVTALPRTPLAPDPAGEEDWLGGVLWTWSDYDPRNFPTGAR